MMVVECDDWQVMVGDGWQAIKYKYQYLVGIKSPFPGSDRLYHYVCCGKTHPWAVLIQRKLQDQQISILLGLETT